MNNRQLISKTDPRALENLATALHDLVESIAATLEPVFNAYIAGDASNSVTVVTESLFSRWCSESGTAPIDRIAEQVTKLAKRSTSGPDLFRITLVERNFDEQTSAEVADALATLMLTGKWTPARVVESLWRLYIPAIKKMMVQTAHVIVARALLYRIGEDTGSEAFPMKVSGALLAQALNPDHEGLFATTPALTLFEQMRQLGEQVLPTLYRLGEFDWWYILTDKRSALGAKDKSNVANLDQQIGLAFKRLFLVLDQYQFQDVDVDVWRNVYQHFLPREERQRLGGFYTPDEIVDTLLDEVGYVPSNPDLASKLLIDPACGSGAFVVAALSRLLVHFAEFPPASLQPGKQPQWVRDQCELEAIQRCLHAIDIHPFAAFLTTINILFLVLPRYIRVKEKNPQFTFEPFIVCHDALFTTAAETKLSLAMQVQLNGRVERAAQDAKQYIELLKKEFDFVVG
ncbi:MAG: N-6 DNA methylase, partial [Tepidisphaeraceae bacterium]